MEYNQENPLFELLYLLRGCKPLQPYLLHLTFQYFDQDPKLAKKLSLIILKYQDANQKNNEGLSPLQVAIKYNQCLAMRFAQSDCRFEFTSDLMSFAVTYCNFQIIEILLFDEGLSVVETQINRANYLSATKLKILRRYEVLEINNALKNNADIYDKDETVINFVPQFPIRKIPDKTSLENVSEIISCCSVSSLIVPITQGIQTIKDKQQYHPNLLRCEKFVTNILQKILKFENPQLDMLMLLILQQSRSDFVFQQISELIDALDVPIPQKPLYKTFDLQILIERHCSYFGKIINNAICEYQDKLRHRNKLDCKRVLSAKLQHDISYIGPDCEFLQKFHEQFFQHSSLFYILKKPEVPSCTNLTLLSQFEQLNEIDRRVGGQLSQTIISMVTQNQ